MPLWAGFEWPSVHRVARRRPLPSMPPRARVWYGFAAAATAPRVIRSVAVPGCRFRQRGREFPGCSRPVPDGEPKLSLSADVTTIKDKIEPRGVIHLRPHGTPLNKEINTPRVDGESQRGRRRKLRAFIPEADPHIAAGVGMTLVVVKCDRDRSLRRCLTRKSSKKVILVSA